MIQGVVRLFLRNKSSICEFVWGGAPTAALLLIVTVLFVGCAGSENLVRNESETQTTNLEAPLEFVDKAAWVEPHSAPSGRYSDKFPDIVLVDHLGKKHRFYQDLVRDKVVLVQFFYTTCDGI